jgi:hypothetical protein
VFSNISFETAVTALKAGNVRANIGSAVQKQDENSKNTAFMFHLDRQHGRHGIKQHKVKPLSLCDIPLQQDR